MKHLFLFCLFLSVTTKADMEKNAKIYVAGHRGLVGSALMRKLAQDGYTNIITRGHKELDLRNQQTVYDFFQTEKPEYVFLAAAKVGGIQANIDAPADFFYDNLAIELNVIDAAYKNNVKKLLFLGSSCIYPRDCPQPMKEEFLMAGPLEKSNESYALAKIAGLKLCEAYNKQYKTKFISCMPTNLYGPGDNFDLRTSHVLPALLKKLYQAKINNEPSVSIWGSGNAFREFLYVDDLADACLFLMNSYDGFSTINVGVGHDLTIRQLAELIKQIVGFEGTLIFDTTKPDGTPKKLLDVSKIQSLGWHASTHLSDGIQKTLQWAIKEKIV